VDGPHHRGLRRLVLGAEGSEGGPPHPGAHRPRGDREPRGLRSGRRGRLGNEDPPRARLAGLLRPARPGGRRPAGWRWQVHAGQGHRQCARAGEAAV